MLQGYPFFGTGAAAPTSDNVTFYDPILGADVSTLTIRGSKRQQKVLGISFVSDAPSLGSRLELRLGNQITEDRVIDVFPTLDGDLATQPVTLLNFQDLGGIPINEDETIDIRLFDPGAAELMAGVLWLEDGEPTRGIPPGRIITLLCGGTNDVTTDLAVTGFDMDSVKLVNEHLYTPFAVIVRPEDKILQALLLKAGKDSMTLPPSGKMVYPSMPLQFSGSQWNNGFVKGYAEAQAATKFEAIIFCTESASDKTPPANAPPLQVAQGSGITQDLMAPITGVSARAITRPRNSILARRV